jgi:uncharacterized membrane protein
VTPDLLTEWIGLLLRWVHVIAALAWIGASFYLISWENKFNRSKGLREGVEGDFWTIQGGDFYFVEKIRGAPERLPETLHWFKYEAYLTWLSGFALTCVLYYSSAGIMLLDGASPLQSPGQAVSVSVASLGGTWLAYALYCRTQWARNLRVSALVGILLTAALAAFYGYFFNGRAALIHLGAALGTIMSANVFFSIIPWHRRLIAAIESGRPLEGIYRDHPGFRSRHNHYLTLPVLFLMLCVHAPVRLDGAYAWLAITLLVSAMGLFKYFHTCLQRRVPAMPYLLAGLLIFGTGAGVAALDTTSPLVCDFPIDDARASDIIDRRCSACHDSGAGRVAGLDGNIIPAWDSPEVLVRFREQILDQVMVRRTMPPANTTAMTEQERNTLACWLQQGPAQRRP